MRSAPAGLKTWLGGRPSVAFRAELITLTLLDGTTKYRWTTAEANVTTGGFTWLAPIGGAAPLITAPPYRQNLFPAIDTFDLTLAGLDFKINGLTLPLLAIQGYFDGARVNVDHLIGGDINAALGFGPIPSYFEGRVAGMEPRWPDLLLRVKSSLNELNLQLPKFLYQPQCGHAVYDTNCGASRAAFTDTGTATGGTTTTVTSTTAAIIAKANGWYNLGVLAFTSGAQNGVRRAIQNFTVSGGIATFTLGIPLSIAPSNGDGLSVYPGCDLSRLQCSAAKFNRLASWRAFPHIPSTESGGK